jgi:hypothetical protein
MRALFAVNKLDVYDQFYIVCPHCQAVIDEEDLEVDDYVADNCLIWCHDNCGEMLICPRGYHSPKPSIDNIITTGIEKLDSELDNCTEIVSREKAAKHVGEKILDEIGYRMQDGVKKYGGYPDLNIIYYLVGVLKITHLISSDEFDRHYYKNKTEAEIAALVEENYHEVNITRFSDCPANIDTCHDGINLYYKGQCTHCNKNYESFIFGD